MEEWTKFNCGQISELKYGKGLKGYRDLQSDIPVYGTNGYIGQTEKALCKKEGIIVGRKGAYRGIHYSQNFDEDLINDYVLQSEFVENEYSDYLEEN